MGEKRRGLEPDSPDTLIDEAGEESFPASDPPATWAGRDLSVDPD